MSSYIYIIQNLHKRLYPWFEFPRPSNLNISGFLQEWSAISMEAHELLQQLLSKDPMKRLSAEAALKATWLTKAWHPECHGSKG